MGIESEDGSKSQFGPPPMPEFFPGVAERPQETTRLKSTGAVISISFFAPGFGTIAAGNFARGFLIFLVFAAFLFAALINPVSFLLAFGVWAYGIVDAYRSARRYNSLHSIVYE